MNFVNTHSHFYERLHKLVGNHKYLQMIGFIDLFI
jgi:hypothetical protein